ncbi:MAG TPA: universal stress protein [Terriglobia bacterium]|nr:universal stress protein [Terriglobia bacterium]
MFQRILVPVDLTEKSLAAVDMAYQFAEQSGAEIILVHVIETIEHIQFDELKPFYERLEVSARNGLAECAERFVSHNLLVDTAILYGHRSQEIIEFARAKPIDLIILSSHKIDPDRPGHDWSSISYSVAILSPCPVLLLK